MKNRTLIAASVAAVFAIAILPAESTAETSVKLTVLDPRGEIASPPLFAPRARISDLSGKKIGIYWNGKAGGNYFWNIIEPLVKQKLPNASVLRYNGAYDIGDSLAAKMAGEVDAFLYGVGD
jgi:hypothetical protein